MTTYRVNVAVKQAHTAEGVRGDPYCCPMTRALEDVTGQWGNCWVGLCTASVTIPGGAHDVRYAPRGGKAVE